MTRYWDWSSLVGLLLGNERVFKLCEPPSPRMVVSWYCSILSVYSLKTREELTVQRRRALEEQLQALLAAAYQVQPTDSVMGRGTRLMQVHPNLDPGRALELASALIWAEERPHMAVLVSLDERVREAARAEGFRVLPYDD